MDGWKLDSEVIIAGESTNSIYHCNDISDSDKLSNLDKNFQTNNWKASEELLIEW